MQEEICSFAANTQPNIGNVMPKASSQVGDTNSYLYSVPLPEKIPRDDSFEQGCDETKSVFAIIERQAGRGNSSGFALLTF